MAFILQDSEPAMQMENQLYAIPCSVTDRWKTEQEKLSPTTILSDEGGLVILFSTSYHTRPVVIE